MNAYYELINPSDYYTLCAADAKTAILAALLLGEGRYGLRDEEGTEVLPVFIFGGLDEWLLEQHDCNVDQLLEQVDPAALAMCFDSFAICRMKDRRLWDAALEAIDDPNKKATWLAKWHDAKRSSMNDIGALADHYADWARKKVSLVTQP